jgi:hypothetical protein
MKKVILILFVAAKMFSQSSSKFESSESFTINVNSDMAITAGIGDNINAKEKMPLISSGSGKNAVYNKMLNRVFYNGEIVNDNFLNNSKGSIIFNIVNGDKRQIIEKLYFFQLDNNLKLEKSETLVIINEKF